MHRRRTLLAACSDIVLSRNLDRGFPKTTYILGFTNLFVCVFTRFSKSTSRRRPLPCAQRSRISRQRSIQVSGEDQATKRTLEISTAHTRREQNGSGMDRRGAPRSWAVAIDNRVGWEQARLQVSLLRKARGERVPLPRVRCAGAGHSGLLTVQEQGGSHHQRCV